MRVRLERKPDLRQSRALTTMNASDLQLMAILLTIAAALVPLAIRLIRSANH